MRATSVVRRHDANGGGEISLGLRGEHGAAVERAPRGPSSPAQTRTATATPDEVRCGSGPPRSVDAHGGIRQIVETGPERVANGHLAWRERVQACTEPFATGLAQAHEQAYDRAVRAHMNMKHELTLARWAFNDALDGDAAGWHAAARALCTAACACIGTARAVVNAAIAAERCSDGADDDRCETRDSAILQ